MVALEPISTYYLMPLQKHTHSYREYMELLGKLLTFLTTTKTPLSLFFVTAFHCFLNHTFSVVIFVFRILFPMLSGGDQNVSKTGLMKVEGFSDPDDYVDIESGQTDTLHNIIFVCRIYILYDYT